MEPIKLNPGVIDQFSWKEEGVWVHGFLSNGYMEPDGTFVEREYQAAKALYEEDAARILACEKPFGKGGSKELGRAVKLRPDWEQVKFQVMARLVLKKFTDHPELAEKLLATGNAQIVEGNTWHDNTFGDCKCGRLECATPGFNWLGQILMCVRETLRQRATQTVD